MPYERLVMIAFAYAGYILVGFLCVFMWYVGRRAVGSLFAAGLVVVTACIVSLGWADGVAHLGKQAVLGPCNPFYAACSGEHEGWTGPTTGDSPMTREIWHAMKCGPPPGGNAHPILPWWGNPASGTWCR